MLNGPKACAMLQRLATKCGGKVPRFSSVSLREGATLGVTDQERSTGLWSACKGVQPERVERSEGDTHASLSMEEVASGALDLAFERADALRTELVGEVLGVRVEKRLVGSAWSSGVAPRTAEPSIVFTFDFMRAPPPPPSPDALHRPPPALPLSPEVKLQAEIDDAGTLLNCNFCAPSLTSPNAARAALLLMKLRAPGYMRAIYQLEVTSSALLVYARPPDFDLAKPVAVRLIAEGGGLTVHRGYQGATVSDRWPEGVLSPDALPLEDLEDWLRVLRGRTEVLGFDPEKWTFKATRGGAILVEATHPRWQGKLEDPRMKDEITFVRDPDSGAWSMRRTRYAIPWGDPPPMSPAPPIQSQ